MRTSELTIKTSNNINLAIHDDCGEVAPGVEHGGDPYPPGGGRLVALARRQPVEAVETSERVQNTTVRHQRHATASLHHRGHVRPLVRHRIVHLCGTQHLLAVETAYDVDLPWNMEKHILI